VQFDPEYLVFGVALLALTQLGAAATGFEMPGTIELDDPLAGGSGDGQDACTIKTKVGISGKLSGAAINQDSFRITDARPTGFLASAVAGGGPLSFLGTTDVEMQYTLNGPIDGSYSTTKQVGDGSLGATEEATSDFKATNLPPGTYHLHQKLYHAKGNDYLEAVITIHDDCSAGIDQVRR